jgi:hypothetical protein
LIDIPKGMDNQAFEVIVMPLGQIDSPMLNLLKIENNEQLSQDFWKSVALLQTEAEQNGLTPEALDELLKNEE